MKRGLWAVVLVGLLAGPGLAQQGGFILFGPKSSEQVLSYRSLKDRAGAQQSGLDLFLQPQKVAVRQIQILFPERFKSSFDPSQIEMVDQESGTVFAIENAQIDAEAKTLTLIARDPIPASVPLTLRLRNITNPRSPGIHRLRARLLGTEPNPIYRYVGDWYITIT
ncbi:DUF2808 domain-containing protein [Candidatus Cyanaurora vandensis]|uniref:DUF2808 domain-containing protein n=1 Tax=Candidatus Cyanaurora vandensis TaxID=2714958 RepID=UPI00257C33BF|nr:DUF2808 domain-containing protein [Candidatus Cyanaurora vandensis]